MSDPTLPTPSPDARRLWRVAGKDALTFLQGLVTNDLRPLGAAAGLIWTALLSPQGKYLADFFVLRRESDTADTLHLDLHPAQAAQVVRLLTLYKLRADVTLAQSALELRRALPAAHSADAPPNTEIFADPRHPALGLRIYGETLAPEAEDFARDYDAQRVRHRIPEFPNELIQNDSYILEFDFERLHGVDFRKGCYVGQEVTARMKHKTELRKGLVSLAITGSAPPGTPITLEDGREAGRLGTSADGAALAWMRFDRQHEALKAGEATLAPIA